MVSPRPSAVPDPAAPPATLHLGISGWSYRDWSPDFYPCGLPARDYLAHYARHYNAVEINSTFYRTPSPETVLSWRAAATPGFRFAAKLPRAITHEARLRDPEAELARFFQAMDGLAEHRGPLLAQLPPNLRRDDGLLRGFLDRVAEAPTRHRWGLAVEFRHRSWLAAEVVRMLDRRGVALCLSDMPRSAATEPGSSPLVYIRRHGPGGDYRGRYNDESLAADAGRIRAWLGAGRAVWCFFNHGLGGRARADAERLGALLGRDGRAEPEGGTLKKKRGGPSAAAPRVASDQGLLFGEP